MCVLVGLCTCVCLDWSPCSIRNFTIRFMPIPIIDASQALKANPEKTEDALLKVRLHHAFIMSHQSARLPKKRLLEPRAVEPIKHAHSYREEESPFSYLAPHKGDATQHFFKGSCLVYRPHLAVHAFCFYITKHIQYKWVSVVEQKPCWVRKSLDVSL